MDRKLVKKFRWFLLTDYEKEEAFLREKHMQGYKLIRVMLPGIYCFERCEPEDVIYKLDFNPQSTEEKKRYVQMYTDYGWEYLQDLNDYSYFRKSACDEDESDLTIFSDDQSKLDMLKRIFLKRMVPLLFIFLLFGITQVMVLANGGINESWNGGVIVFCLVFIPAYLAIFVYCGVGFYRLKKNYSRGV